MPLESGSETMTVSISATTYVGKQLYIGTILYWDILILHAEESIAFLLTCICCYVHVSVRDIAV